MSSAAEWASTKASHGPPRPGRGARAGNAVAKVLNLDASDPAEKKRIKERLKAWIENGALKKIIKKDAKRKDRIFIEVGKWAT
jgi:hypothetical protein